MDRFAAMLILLGLLVSLVLVVVALFTVAPVVCSCMVSLLYSLYVFMAYEEAGGAVQHAGQEFENQFWTVFAILLSAALLFAKDSPIAFGLWYSPTIGFVCVILSGYGMHLWDRHQHRVAMSQQARIPRLRRSSPHGSRGTSNASTSPVNGSNGSLNSAGAGYNNNNNNNGNGINTTTTNTTNGTNSNNSSNNTLSSTNQLNRLHDLGIPVQHQLERINSCLMEIDQLLIPSTINNFINQRFVLTKEREIIQIFEECDARALNYLICHVKLGLLFYKIKDHNYFNGKNRTEFITLLAVERLPILTVISRVIVLHSLQLLKLRANPRAEDWVRNIILNTHQDELSELKTLTDAKGDYFCMNKLIFDDIRSVSVRQDILNHIRREATIQQTHMLMGTGRRHRQRYFSSSIYEYQQWRKILSDVDDTLCSSGGMYPAGVDKRYPKKAVYPGVLAFYRELDLGLNGPDEWTDDRVGNLVFLSARPHVYKDMSEKRNFAKFERLREAGTDGRKGLHTMPSLLAGDLSSGRQYILTDDFEPLAQKKYDNFRRYVSIYPEYQHVFVCDNGQGDVRAGELMFDNFPYEFEQLYVHIVQDIDKTYGYNPHRWHDKEFKPCFFRTYPEAALHAASVQRHNNSTATKPPLISVRAVQRICQDAKKDFDHIGNWASDAMKSARRMELNQGIWLCNEFLIWHNEEPVPLLRAEQKWASKQKVRTPYGIGTICDFDPYFDLYTIELDWRPLDMQYNDHLVEMKSASIKPRKNTTTTSATGSTAAGTTSVASTSGVTNNTSTITTSTRSIIPSSRPPVTLSTVVESTTEDEEIPGATATITTTNTTTSAHDDDNDQSSTNFINAASSVSSSTEQSEHHILPLDERQQQEAAAVLQHEQEAREGVPTIQQEIGEPSAERPQTLPQQQQQQDLPVVPINPIQQEPLPATVPIVANEASTQENDPSSDNASQQPAAIVTKRERKVYAQVNGRFITKYTPPVLPKFEHNKSSRSLFPFLLKKSDSSIASSNKKTPFKVGDKWTTPYGPAKIVEYREKQGIVVVDMIGWKARAYLKQEILKKPSSSIIGTLLRQLSHAGTSTVEIIEKKPPPDYPYPEGTKLHTPYGKGVVSRPLPNPNSKHNLDITKNRSLSVPTVGISLNSWTLANGKHPTLYATVETTRHWNETKVAAPSIFSTLGTLVTTSRTLLEPLFIPKPPTIEVPKVVYKRYYKEAAAVSTPYGDGRVVNFRDTDGFYEIALSKWVLADGRHPSVFLREDDISHLISKGCLEGYPVYTSLGLTGRLVSVEPTTGVHIVTLPYAGIICYLQPEAVLRPLKAAVNEEVFTPYGNGKVVRYNPNQDTYTITLAWGATLYAKGDTFDRVGDGIPDEEARFGVNWLLSFFYRHSDSSTLTRSRSNSIVSSNRSVT